MIIRKASVEDLPMIMEIVNYEILHSTSNYAYEEQSLEETQRWYEHRISGGFPVFVSLENSIITGYGTYGPFREKAGYRHTVEHTVYIHFNHRGKGCGKSLLDALIQEAKRQQHHVMLGGIDAKNESSILFHEKMGFEKVSYFKEVGRKFDTWLDLVFMSKTLDEE